MLTGYFNFSAISFLVVDDSRAMCSLVRQCLISFGAKLVYTSSSSSEALAFLRRPEIDVAIIDYQLSPEDPMTGLDIVRTLRQYPEPINRRPVIFCTAYSDQKTVIAARDAGVNDVMTKPFSIESLYTKLITVLSTPRPFVISEGYIGPLWPQQEELPALRLGISL